MPTNNDYLSDIAGEERNTDQTNNQLLEKIASNGSSAGLSNEERALLNTIPNKADLVNGMVPESQLPSFVDAVQQYESREAFPDTGESNVIYLNDTDNTTFRWSGSTYIQIASGVVIGETSSSAHRGDHGVIAYNHTLLTNNPHNVTKGQIGLGNVDNTSDASKPISSQVASALLMKENVITPSTTDNYYRGDKTWAQLNKAAVGLSNVDNTSDEDKPVSAPQRNALGVKADLVNGRVPTSQLPSYVDAVQEYATLSNFPATGQMNVVYLAVDTNKPYRWGGTTYVEIASGVALGETSSTAYRGDRGKVAFDHTSLMDNPHGVTKSQVGLSNVDNTADMSKPVSTPQQTALNGKANFPGTNNSVPVRNGAGDNTSVTYSAAATANAIPLRTATSQIKGVTPVADDDLATKQYVDDHAPEIIGATVLSAPAETIIVENIPATAADRLRFELQASSISAPSFIRMVQNGSTGQANKDVIIDYDGSAPAIIRHNQTQGMRIFSGAGNTAPGILTQNLMINGTITNDTVGNRFAEGTAIMSGGSSATQPEVQDFKVVSAQGGVVNQKINSLRFDLQAGITFAAGTRLAVYAA